MNGRVCGCHGAWPRCSVITVVPGCGGAWLAVVVPGCGNTCSSGRASVTPPGRGGPGTCRDAVQAPNECLSLTPLSRRRHPFINSLHSTRPTFSPQDRLAPPSATHPQAAHPPNAHMNRAAPNDPQHGEGGTRPEERRAGGWWAGFRRTDETGEGEPLPVRGTAGWCRGGAGIPPDAVIYSDVCVPRCQLGRKPLSATTPAPESGSAGTG